MALIEFKDYPDVETPLSAENLNHNFDYLNLRGSTAVFSKTDSQDIPSGQETIIKFNHVEYIDDDVFSLESDGTIKVLKDISRVLCTINIRTDAKGGIVYVGTNQSGGFNVLTDSTNTVANGSGVLEVKKDSKIKVSTYRYAEGSIDGYDRNWCSINLVVLR